MSDSPSKKEKEKKKAREKQEKADRAKERKFNSNKGKSLEDMLAYLDENGNITSTPPDPTKRKEVSLDDIQLGAAKKEEENPIRTGTVAFFNDAKGFGFITDDVTRENVFVHVNNIAQPLKERDKVTFETEHTPKGLSAILVKKI
jgi:cold shock CspA family protein